LQSKNRIERKMLNSVLIVIGYSLFEFDGAPQKKRNLVIRKEQVVLNVGAASSREINCRGWKPLPHSIPLVLSG